MHFPRITLALLGLAGALFAADPFVGTWKLNAAKSKFKAGEPPKEQTVVIEQQGDNIRLTITGTSATGAPISYGYTVPAAGGKGTVQESPIFDSVSTKRVDPDTRETMYLKAGKQVMTVRAVAAKDGKTMRVTVKGTDAQGKPVDGVALYEKQ
jgi:hypothetical protein